ncbi:MAG: ATP-binding protein, partial [Verrucomicrobiaceae bacterium]
RMPCLYLDPFSGRSPSRLGVLWDAIALTNGEKQVVEALRIISPDIEAVSMIGSENGNRSRTVIAKSRQFRAPVSLRTFGDGVNRLFGIILSLVNAAGGVLLVDEIENGLHHSILPEVWRVIFQMADELNVQIFATSHSWDCVDSFQQAANVHPQTGVLARLTALDGRIIPTLFSENELRIAARDQIEVR